MQLVDDPPTASIHWSESSAELALDWPMRWRGDDVCVYNLSEATLQRNRFLSPLLSSFIKQSHRNMPLQLSGLPALSKPAGGCGFTVSKVAAALGTYLLTRYFSSQSSSKGKVNLEHNKDSAKVVHSFDIEDIGKKAVYCRCWRSKKFPYCDGAHAKHNEETGDNVGPLIIKRRDA
ncbi:CDGSH iron-sulfur domain-containing protein 1 isoform X2 [Hoplias malabaricus]|uniref:CDGSH iron-sulfur domain-containing protein 1 isoform X2 n=1 Tax=Hoplias malabaricus TaxID=27720 RepID=UPI0034627F71